MAESVTEDVRALRVRGMCERCVCRVYRMFFRGACSSHRSALCACESGKSVVCACSSACWGAGVRLRCVCATVYLHADHTALSHTTPQIISLPRLRLKK